MSQYGMLSAIFMSFYSKKLYRDVALNWGGKAFLYLLFVLALSWIWLCITLQHSISTYYAKHSDAFVAQIPEVVVKDGKVSTPENKPYIITYPDTNNTLAIIDTSGQYKSLDNVDAAFLLTETQFISKPKPDQTRVDDISKTVNMTFEPQSVNAVIKKYVGFTWVLFFVVFLLLAFIGRIIQALLYGILGKIFAACCNAPVTYGQIVSITLVAITPALVIDTILIGLNISFPLQWLSYFALTLLYIFYGILANKN